MPRFASFVAVLACAVAAKAQVTLSLGGAPNYYTVVGGATTLQLLTNAVVTLTALDFQIGPGTASGANAYVSIWLCTGGELEARNGFASTLIGTTVPVTATGVSGQVVSAAIVPAAPFAAVTLPSGGWFGITLLAHNCSLMTKTGTLSSSTAQLSASGGAQFTALPGTSSQVSMLNQRYLSGAIQYSLGGTPMNLAEIQSFGAGCGGLLLTGSGGSGLGQTVTLTTTPAVPTPSLGVCIVTLDSLLIQGPGGLDLGNIGMQGCGLLVNQSAGYTATIGNLPAGPASLAFSFPVPNNLAFRGWVLWSQSAWLQPGLNPAGMALSNGVRLRVW